MLIAMATGTGKTYLTVSQVYRLLDSGMFKRILFLVDRKALAAQAVRTFSSFDTPNNSKFDKEFQVFSQAFQKNDFGDEEPFNPKLLPSEYLTNPKSNHSFVYVCTIQRMAMNLYGSNAISEDDATEAGDAVILDIPIHAFDLVIADECHRGYTSKESSAWRDTLEYFDCVKIGLTATPAPHSLSLFKEIVYRYTTEEAIDDGWLVDYEAVKITSGVKINGVFLREGENVGIVDDITGRVSYDLLEDEREYVATEIEKNITVPDTNEKIIRELKLYAEKFEEENGRFPKTLIFAVNDKGHTSHADQVVRLCRSIFNRGDAFVEKITGNVDRPLQKIREFRNRPEPKVVVTVDMLSTGVDIPALEFIVFMRPVKSRILWTQMLGRGTRLYPDIHKSHFTIFDCFGGTLIEYFKDTNEFKPEPPQKDPVSIEKLIDNIWQNIDRDYNINVLVKRLHRIDKKMSGEARDRFAEFITDGDMGRFASGLKDSVRNNFIETIKILRNENFQDLLVNYPRGKSSFVIALDTIDTVTSEWVFRIGDDVVKPEDYLLSFERFVKENPEQIEAIEILLNRPKDWRTDTLDDLRQKMRKSNFKEDDLQKAHKIVYNKALADIISMVKRASESESPIYTAQERVELVMQKFMGEQEFSEEQIKWLELIRGHLIENLAIHDDDFEFAPIFDRMGGKSKAKKVFGENLSEIVAKLNELIAA
jgi:type I restriction enzyme R subunit